MNKYRFIEYESYGMIEKLTKTGWLKHYIFGIEYVWKRFGSGNNLEYMRSLFNESYKDIKL